MKKLSLLYLVLFLVSGLFFTSCEKEDPIVETPEFTVLKDSAYARYGLRSYHQKP